MRIYDTRLGRFLSVDPISKKYPYLTPYQFASNSPISGIDIDGLEYASYNEAMYRMIYQKSTYDIINANGTKQTIASAQSIVKTVYENIPEVLKDPLNKDFKFVSGGEVSAFGNDFTGPSIRAANKYYYKSPAFLGSDNLSMDGTEGEASSSMKGVKFGYEGPTPATLAEGAKALVEIGINFSNADLSRGLGKQSVAKSDFYKATNTVDRNNKNLAFGGTQLNGQTRADLINFMTDGYLSTGNGKMADIKQALNVANMGVQALGQLGKLQNETIKSVNGILDQYKKLGGDTNDFHEMSQYLNKKSEQ